MTPQPDPQLVAEVDAIYHGPTAFRDDTKPPVIGTAPPVAQPGVPPMSQQATDIGRAAMYCGLATVPPGLVAALVLVASEHADPTVIGIIAAAPAVLMLALSRLLKTAGQAAPPEVHQHFNGPVQNTTQNITSKATLWSKTTNQL